MGAVVKFLGFVGLSVGVGIGLNSLSLWHQHTDAKYDTSFLS